ncbi:MAG: M48 family metallopeptidase [Flavobacteriaceae bacterium]|nr:M48 family metallopeptidase [Flavobacteriaceae bacterium]
MNDLTVIITLVIIVNFGFNYVLDALNAKMFKTPLPKLIQDVYDSEKYEQSVAYKVENHRFDKIEALVGFLIMLGFLWLGGFGWTDQMARIVSENEVIIALIFFGILGLGSDLLGIPFSYYHTFVIEERFGFNKQTRKLFWTDKLKSWLLAGILGSVLLLVVIKLYAFAGDRFWWYAWLVITAFTVFMNLFYAQIFVPLFNKQTPLSKGSLRDKIEAYANKVNFSLQNIYVIDGSKRSTKANAYFSGFGKQKRITLYDTLIESLSEEEIVAVLAHEVGHYKKKHILWQMLVSILTMGVTLYILSLSLRFPLFSEALGIPNHSFHAGLVSFSLLYSPISMVLGVFGNLLSRKFEFQADAFAAETYRGEHLVGALKKLSSDALNNLTPHPAYVFVHYSHPPLLARILHLQGVHQADKNMVG